MFNRYGKILKCAPEIPNLVEIRHVVLEIKCDEVTDEIGLTIVSLFYALCVTTSRHVQITRHSNADEDKGKAVYITIKQVRIYEKTRIRGGG
jgi:hypothetical protein